MIRMVDVTFLIAAYNRRAERLMIPLLDVLQGIPVLGFLPGLVLGMVGLFPHSNVGLELACVLMIFTGQVWNMTFSFYGSLRAIPVELREVARVHRFGWWKRFMYPTDRMPTLGETASMKRPVDEVFEP